MIIVIISLTPIVRLCIQCLDAKKYNIIGKIKMEKKNDAPSINDYYKN